MFQCMCRDSQKRRRAEGKNMLETVPFGKYFVSFQVGYTVCDLVELLSLFPFHPGCESRCKHYKVNLLQSSLWEFCDYGSSPNFLPQLVFKAFQQPLLACKFLFSHYFLWPAYITCSKSGHSDTLGLLCISAEPVFCQWFWGIVLV